MDHARKEKSRFEKAEETRLRALYRRLAMRGGSAMDRVPVSALTSLIGPDCAYHLYHRVMPHKRGGRGEDERA